MEKRTYTNEDLVILYRTTKNEKYLQELINKNTPIISVWAREYMQSIPNAELEDLISESYIPMLRAIERFEENSEFTFVTLLRACVKQHLNRLYKGFTRKKRYTGSTPVSYESLVEINKEGGDITETSFTVECDDYSNIEFFETINSLNLSEKEQVVVKILAFGGSKGDVAKALKCTPATANYYFKSIRKKITFAGVAV